MDEATIKHITDRHAQAVVDPIDLAPSRAVQSRWEDRGGPDAQIVEAAPVG